MMGVPNYPKNDGSETLYAYDESGTLIGEYDSSGAAIQESVYFNGAPIAVLEGANAYYVHTDHLGTPRAITDGSTVIWRWESDPFGTTAAQEDPDGDLTRFTYNLRFPGQYYDQETGMHYNYYRTYDPSTGRYLESDPIGLVAGPNTYAYVGSNPLSLTDPNGECPWCIAAVVGGLADLGVQLLMNGGKLQCVKWKQVFVAGAASAAGVGLAQKLGKVSTIFGGPKRPTYRFFQRKGIVRAEAHPILRSHPDWLSYSHLHLDFLPKSLAKRHLPLVEPLSAAASAAQNLNRDSNCDNECGAE